MKRCLLLALLLPAVAHGADPEVAKWIKVMGTSAEERPYTALNELIKLGPKAISACHRLFLDKKEAPYRRFQALKVLGALKATKTLDDVLAGVGDPNWMVASVAAETVGLIGDRSVAPKLAAFKKSVKHPQVRQAINEALTKLGAPPATDDTVVPATSTAAALARAKKENKLVLALVRGAFREDAKPTFFEETFAACALHHPDVARLVRTRFVMLRMHYTPWLYTFGNKDPRDPLPVLGTSILKTKAPALVVTTGAGKHVATLESIGTYDAWLVHAFLARAARKALGAVPAKTVEEALDAGDLGAARKAARRLRGAEKAYGLARADGLAGKAGAVVRHLQPHLRRKPEARVEAGVAWMRQGEFDKAADLLERAANAKADGPRRDEAAYYLGCLKYREGSRGPARELWQRIEAGSAWARKAGARLKWPERMAMFECLQAPALDKVRGSTEAKADADTVVRALAYLATQQQPDGSWINPKRYRATEPAITALCARALFEHGAHPEAVKRATAWLRAYMKREDAADANGWSSAYILDYFVARLRKDKSFRKDAQAAVAFALGGQCPNGAWSYSRNWGLRWKGGFGGWPKTDQGRFHSMNTGPCLVALLFARDAGLKVDKAALERGRDVLLKMREEAGRWTYTYPEPRNFHKKPQSSIGRAPTCELALHKLGAAPRADLEKTMEYFMAFRAGLRRSVKLSSSWMPPQMASSYFYHFAYLHAAVALDVLEDAKSRELLRKDMLQVAEADGTWVDYEETGKPYATAMALLVLAGGK